MQTNKKLLILDDDELICKTVADVATKDGFAVHYTTDYKVFNERLTNWQPTHIFIDLIMPVVDGVQILNELAKQANPAKIVISSGAGERVIEAAARSAKARGLNIIGILHKPFYVKQIREMLSEPLQQASTTKALLNAQPLAAPDANVLVSKLKTAIAEKKITFAVQPIIKCRTQQIKGFEVLARWHDEELGVISPEVFIQLAEQQGEIDTLTLLIFQQALPWFNQFIAHAPLCQSHKAALTLSINISARSLSNDAVVSKLAAICQEQAIAPQNVILELTETAALEDPIRSMDLLTRLRLTGFKLSIDDFGTGFSSMLQLVRLPFSELKIDRSFSMSALAAEESKIVIEATIDLAHRLGLTVTAEGIENEETCLLLKRFSTDFAQGYYIARPMAPEAVYDWLAKQQQPSEERRLAILKAYELLDTPEEERFDRITRLASRLLKMPVSVISLLDAQRQWFKSRAGTALKETVRSVAFCDKTIRDPDALVVHDAQTDQRFKDNPLVTGSPHIRFYAGYPIRLTEGDALGTLCVMDDQPRAFSAHDVALLKGLTALVSAEIQEITEAYTDNLTELLNRKSFEKRAELLNELCHAQQLYFMLLYFDLDKFAALNAQYGRVIGDEVLQAFAMQLKATFAGADLIARVAGDEFLVVLVDNLPPTPEPAIVALRESCQRLKHANNALPPVSVSVGSATSSVAQPFSLQQLYHAADVRMISDYNQHT